MARLVHLNGPPGIGKSTLSALHTDRNPGTLNLDVDRLHRLVGGWQDEEHDTWQVVWPLVRAMAATHVDGGSDVVLPQYHARLEEITTRRARSSPSAQPSAWPHVRGVGRTEHSLHDRAVEYDRHDDR